MLINDVKLNNADGFEIIDLKGVLFMKKGSYFLKYRMRSNFFRKLYILLSKILIIRRKINKFVN